MTNKYQHNGFDTMFFSFILNNGKLSQDVKNQIVLNSTLNPAAPSIQQLDKLIENGIVKVVPEIHTIN
jgi:hypothetical protein